MIQPVIQVHAPDSRSTLRVESSKISISSSPRRWAQLAILLLLTWCLNVVQLGAQQPLAADAEASAAPTAAENAPPPLAGDQKIVAERFSRLEILLLRSADLESGENPARAALLQQAVQLSKQADLTQLLADAAARLEQGQFSEAIEKQKSSRESLKRLLELLQSENREQRIREERDEVRRWIEETDRLLRLQSSLRGRTEGGQEIEQAAADQQKLTNQAGEIADELKSQQPTPDADPTDQPESPQQGEPQQGEPQQGGPQEQPQAPRSPAERAQEKIEEAKQNMQEAQERLQEAQREGAVEKQQQAEERLREAIEELEEILRQLREEEVERSLASLETRLRRMLDMQNKVLEETSRLQEITDGQADRQVQIAASKLSLDELKILAEGERALLLLRDEGSSAAFPEAVQQLNTDIQSVADRLQTADVSPLTTIIEQEIVSSLEEMVAALVQVQKENREKQQSPPGQSPPGGEPGDQPLVDKLAELRLIRTLQLRINKRTDSLSKLLSDPADPTGQAAAGDILQQLQGLGERQASIQSVTRDIVVGKGE